MSKEVLKNILNELIESIQGIAIATLKQDGDTSESCQLQGLLNSLDQASHHVNGIECVDIRAFTESGLTDKDRDSGYQLENLVMDITSVSQKAEDMVSKSLFARTDLANMVRKGIIT